MAFGSSAIFQQAMLNPMLGRLWTTAAPTTFGSLSADDIRAALYPNTITPNKADTAANCAYNAGQWLATSEITDANWAAGGRALASKAFTIDTTSSSVAFQAAALAGGGNMTVAGVFGCLIYDNTVTAVSKQGLCYNYFGGTQGVTGGTFTIIWATVGGLSNVVVFNVTV